MTSLITSCAPHACTLNMAKIITAKTKKVVNKAITPNIPQKRLRALGSHWTHDKKRQVLVGEFFFTRYLDAFMFATRVTVYAEVHKHYPEICITPKLVKITLVTPLIGAVTEMDLAMAERINQIISTVH